MATTTVPKYAFRDAAPSRPSSTGLNFEKLVEHYQGPLLRFLFGLVGDREQAADLCQDTFFSAFRAVNRLDADSRLDGWLYTIALNHARGILRRRRVLRWVPFVNAVHDRAVGRDLANRLAAREQLNEVLHELPIDKRACVLLHAEGFRYAEIAQVIGCSLGAVKLRIFRARRRLLDLYGPHALIELEEDA